jgi:GntR family transcriptional repressor for pyruvate dehydrogenase complex
MGATSLRRPPSGPTAGRSLADVLAERLRARIVAGELQPGDRLPGERELAEELGVHRGSLREALRQLERLRLVATRPGSGTRVLDPQHASFELIGEQVASDAGGRWLEELLALRELVTSGSLRLLLERCSPASDALQEVVRALDAAAGSDLPDPAFYEALWGLPASLARAAGNRVFVLLANSVTRFISLRETRESLPVFPADDRPPLAAALRRMARALDARDAERAERACRELSRQLAARLLGH